MGTKYSHISIVLINMFEKKRRRFILSNKLFLGLIQNDFVFCANSGYKGKTKDFECLRELPLAPFCISPVTYKDLANIQDLHECIKKRKFFDLAPNRREGSDNHVSLVTAIPNFYYRYLQETSLEKIHDDVSVYLALIINQSVGVKEFVFLDSFEFYHKSIKEQLAILDSLGEDEVFKYCLDEKSIPDWMTVSDGGDLNFSYVRHINNFGEISYPQNAVNAHYSITDHLLPIRSFGFNYRDLIMGRDGDKLHREESSDMAFDYWVSANKKGDDWLKPINGSKALHIGN